MRRFDILDVPRNPTRERKTKLVAMVPFSCESQPQSPTPARQKVAEIKGIESMLEPLLLDGHLFFPANIGDNRQKEDDRHHSK